jgi:hypothetical protein
MSFINQYRSTTIYGELKVQKYNTGNIAGLLDVSGNALFRGDVGVNGNIYATDGTVDISGNLAVSGNITGTFAGTISDATNSINVGISTDSSNQSFFPTFVSTTTGNLPLKVDAGLTYNPSTNILSCDVSGNLTGTATNATNVTIATDATNATFFPTFVSTTTGNLPPKVDAGLTYNPSTNLLTTTVSSVNVSAVSTASDFRVPFLSATTGSATISSDGGLTYNPSNNRLTVGQLEVTSTPLLSSYVGGVWLVAIGTVDVFYPITTSQTDLADVCSQSTLSPYVKQDAGLGDAGSYSAVDFNNRIDRVIVYPKWGIIAYANTSYAGTLLINYRNSFDFPVSIDVRGGSADTMSSCKIYLDSVEQ